MMRAEGPCCGGGVKGFRRGWRPSQAHVVQPSGALRRGSARDAPSESPGRVSTAKGLLVAAREGLSCLKGEVDFLGLNEKL